MSAYIHLYHRKRAQVTGELAFGDAPTTLAAHFRGRSPDDDQGDEDPEDKESDANAKKRKVQTSEGDGGDDSERRDVSKSSPNSLVSSSIPKPLIVDTVSTVLHTQAHNVRSLLRRYNPERYKSSKSPATSASASRTGASSRSIAQRASDRKKRKHTASSHQSSSAHRSDSVAGIGSDSTTDKRVHLQMLMQANDVLRIRFKHDRQLLADLFAEVDKLFGPFEDVVIPTEQQLEEFKAEHQGLSLEKLLEAFDARYGHLIISREETRVLAPISEAISLQKATAQQDANTYEQSQHGVFLSTVARLVNLLARTGHISHPEIQKLVPDFSLRDIHNPPPTSRVKDERIGETDLIAKIEHRPLFVIEIKTAVAVLKYILETFCSNLTKSDFLFENIELSAASTGTRAATESALSSSDSAANNARQSAASQTAEGTNAYCQPLLIGQSPEPSSSSPSTAASTDTPTGTRRSRKDRAGQSSLGRRNDLRKQAQRQSLQQSTPSGTPSTHNSTSKSALYASRWDMTALDSDLGIIGSNQDFQQGGQGNFTGFPANAAALPKGMAKMEKLIAQVTFQMHTLNCPKAVAWTGETGFVMQLADRMVALRPEEGATPDLAPQKECIVYISSALDPAICTLVEALVALLSGRDTSKERIDYMRTSNPLKKDLEKLDADMHAKRDEPKDDDDEGAGGDGGSQPPSGGGGGGGSGSGGHGDGGSGSGGSGSRGFGPGGPDIGPGDGGSGTDGSGAGGLGAGAPAAGGSTLSGSGSVGSGIGLKYAGATDSDTGDLVPGSEPLSTPTTLPSRSLHVPPITAYTVADSGELAKPSAYINNRTVHSGRSSTTKDTTPRRFEKTERHYMPGMGPDDMKKEQKVTRIVQLKGAALEFEVGHVCLVPHLIADAGQMRAVTMDTMEQDELDRLPAPLLPIDSSGDSGSIRLTLAIGDRRASGRLWETFNGTLVVSPSTKRMHRPMEQLVGPDCPPLLVARTRTISSGSAKSTSSRWSGTTAVSSSTARSCTRVDPDTVLTSGSTIDTTRSVQVPVVIKFACPTRSLRVEQYHQDLALRNGINDDADLSLSNNNPTFYDDDEAMEAINNEARLYTSHLAVLQQRLVPRCYGVWKFAVHSEDIVYAMVLERLDTDKQVGLHMDVLPESVCDAIREQYRLLHAHGVIHSDVEERHFMYRRPAKNAQLFDITRHPLASIPENDGTRHQLAALLSGEHMKVKAAADLAKWPDNVQSKSLVTLPSGDIVQPCLIDFEGAFRIDPTRISITQYNEPSLVNMRTGLEGREFSRRLVNEFVENEMETLEDVLDGMRE